MDESTEFYFREELMAHAKTPHNHGVIKGAVIRQKESNPLCGDEIEMFAQVEKSRLTEIKFEGSGCYISQATASMLTEKIKEMKLSAIQKMNEDSVMEMLGAVATPARKKCAMLSLWTIQKGIENYLNVKKKKDAK
ncbi:MAG: iron-sulfur cluster assembly scaffold protein [bacterium]|nr:iron-sulfur cluster assembly scaffold protein [bacterium]